MSNTAKKTDTTGQEQPDELGALRELVEEFVKKYEHIENEIATLVEARKDLMDEYKEKLDLKTLKAALRVVKIKKGVEHQDTFDSFMTVLDDTEKWDS